MNNQFPQVLLMGNGLNLAYGGTSWSGLIESIKKRDDIDFKKMETHNVPLPLQAILVTNNDLKTAMIEKKSEFWGEIKNPEQERILQEVLQMGFDDILTTNYSYELETAAMGKDKLSPRQLEKMAECTRGRVEPQYLLHSYNRVICNEHENRVWHIHGESRKPNSMILGHYWYANQLSKMKIESDESKDSYLRHQKNGTAPELDSWIDSFILGDVYVLGFGFNLAEIDLWWLLNRKAREKADKGKVYFYEMINEEEYEKVELLRLLGVEPVNFGMAKPDKTLENRNEIYRDFYSKAIADIKNKMQGDLR